MPDGKNSNPLGFLDAMPGFKALETANDQNGKNAGINQAQYQKAAHPNNEGPNGSNTWHQNKDGTYTQQSSFGGPLDGANQALQGQFAAGLGQPLPDGSAARDQAITAAYGQAKSRLDPQWDQREEQQQAQLAAQGLNPNSEAYRNAMGNMGRERNDAYSSAMNGAIGQGTAAGQAIFGQGVISRNLPLQEMQGMQALLPGAAGDNGLQALEAANGYTAQQQGQGADALNGMLQFSGSVAGGAGKAAGGMSDARVKTDIQPLPWDATDGVPLTTFRYTDDPTQTPYMGVIAQELEKAQPDAVTQGPDGLKRVAPQYQATPMTEAQRQAIHALATVPEQQEENQQQRARAAALKKGSGVRHTSMTGALFGGLGDMVDRIRGEYDEGQSDAKTRALIDALQKGRDAYGDYTTGQQDAEAKYRRERDEYQEYLRNGGGNGG